MSEERDLDENEPIDPNDPRKRTRQVCQKERRTSYKKNTKKTSIKIEKLTKKNNRESRTTRHNPEC